jgi:hypothetical protein
MMEQPEMEIQQLMEEVVEAAQVQQVVLETLVLEAQEEMV